MDFIGEHKNHQEEGGLRWGVEPICAVLSEHGVKIAPSTFYEWRDKLPTHRDERDEYLKYEIARVRKASKQLYGPRKVWLRLNREGIPVARCTVERLMNQLGIAGVRRGKVKRTTIAGPGPLPADKVRRNFDPLAPNLLWVADYTYVSTWAGWVYVAFVIDAYARRILGWRCSKSMTTDFVLDALNQAIWQRRREDRDDFTGLVGHTDHGSQYMSIRYSDRIEQAGLTPSTGAVGSSYDNALAETINGLYKTEVIHRQVWHNLDEVEYATAEWVDWYNHDRIYEYCGDIPPIECENAYYARNQARQPVELTQ